jgi:hypothetical protein
MERRVTSIVDRLPGPAGPGGFDPAELDGLPDPVRRYLTTAIQPGAPVARAARLRMRGRIRLGRWLPFRAREVLAPQLGFVWTARVAGVITGSDRYDGGAGRMDWRLGGLVPVARADGPDIARSAATRAGAEALWVPTALLPRNGVRWTADAPDRVTAAFEVDGRPLELRLRLDDGGRVRSFAVDRWGDPDRTGTWGTHRFGGEVTGHHTFGSLTVPSRGRVGWHPGTGRWPAGEFFRYELTSLEPMTA